MKRLLRFVLILSFILVSIATILYFVNDRIQLIDTHRTQDTSLTNGEGGKCELSSADYRNGNKRFADVEKRLTAPLNKALTATGFELGSAVYLRSFKQERELELWMQTSNSSEFSHVHTWSITGLSGSLGPKRQEGDRQSPEGFYRVALPQFLPTSSYHLAFNIGYPNKYDRSHKRTGSFIMVHGSTGSVGCLAMTDPYIEEIYTICHRALSSGQQKSFAIHTFPFRMTQQNMELHKEHKSIEFWRNLKEGYDYFESNRKPPEISVKNKRYQIL